MMHTLARSDSVAKPGITLFLWLVAVGFALGLGYTLGSWLGHMFLSGKWW